MGEGRGHRHLRGGGKVMCDRVGIVGQQIRAIAHDLDCWSGREDPSAPQNLQLETHRLVDLRPVEGQKETRSLDLLHQCHDAPGQVGVIEVFRRDSLALRVAIAVQDAHEMVKQHCHWITPNPGGRHAARDVCELIMQAQGTLAEQLNDYLR